jgi:hypothetical protein
MKLRAWDETYLHPITYIVPHNSPHLHNEEDALFIRRREWEYAVWRHNIDMHRRRRVWFLICKQNKLPPSLFQLVSRRYLREPVPSHLVRAQFNRPMALVICIDVVCILIQGAPYMFLVLITALLLAS